MPRIITDFLDEAVAAVPEKIAFVEDKRSVTYEQLRLEAYKIAMPIINSGLRKLPIAIYLDKCIYSISAMLAVAYSGNFYSVIDTEMPTRLYVERLLAHLTGIEMSRIKAGDYTAEEYDRIQQQIRWIKSQPFVHRYDPDITEEKLYAICKKLKRKMGLQFLVYDYMKSNETSTGDNYNVLGAKCDYLKNKIAGKLDLAVLAACQLNRNGEVADSIKINRYLSVGIKWEYKTPEMIAKDGKECGNAFAKIYVNRLGRQMQEDDEEEYIDFMFDGNIMTIIEAKQHEYTERF